MKHHKQQILSIAAMGLILGVMALMANQPPVNRNEQSVTVDGDNIPRAVVFRLPNDASEGWRWELWVYAAEGWEHAGGHQSPNIGWGRFMNTPEVCAFALAGADTPWGDFQPRFRGRIKPRDIEPNGGDGELPRWVVNATGSFEYQVRPAEKLVCVGTEVTFTSFVQDADSVVPVQSNWTVVTDQEYTSPVGTNVISFVVTPLDPGRYDISGQSVSCSNSSAEAVLNVIKVEITEPKGLPISSDVTTVPQIFRHNPSCFKWQYVHEDNVIEPYSQDITGIVEPLGDPFGCHWSVTAGTLTDAGTPTPTYTADNMTVPQTMTTVDLKLCNTEACDIKQTNRTLEVYRDHLERDYQNFGTGIKCGDIVASTPWSFQRYGETVNMPSTWNCFGSVWHAYNGTGAGQAANVPSSGLAVSTYTHPINWATALAGLNRGDVVVFYSGDTIQHAHTCMGGLDQMYGANNRPGLNIIVDGSGDNFQGHFTGTWHWDITSSQQYYETVNADAAGFFINASGPYLDKIKVYRKQ